VSYLLIFAQSNALEWPLFLLLLIRHLSWKRVLLHTTIANSITHPIVFFGFMNSGWTYLWAVLLAELFAIFGETLIHKGFAYRLPLLRLLVASTFANLVSWQLGPTLTWFWHPNG
jgi:hypothetical protein